MVAGTREGWEEARWQSRGGLEAKTLRGDRLPRAAGSPEQLAAPSRRAWQARQPGPTPAWEGRAGLGGETAIKLGPQAK